LPTVTTTYAAEIANRGLLRYEFLPIAYFSLNRPSVNEFEQTTLATATEVHALQSLPWSRELQVAIANATPATLLSAVLSEAATKYPEAVSEFYEILRTKAKGGSRSVALRGPAGVSAPVVSPA
jgi:hypothetical protein